MGWLSNPEIANDIDQLGDEVVAYLARLGDDQLRRGDLDELLQSYMPVQLTNHASARSKAVQSGKRATGESGVQAGTPIAVLDPSKPRSTNLVEFTGSDGQNKRFLLMEAEAFGTMNQRQIDQLLIEDPEVGTRAAEIKAAVDDFKSIFGSNEVDMRNASRELLPYELNDYASTGALDGLVGGPLMDGSKMWETSMMGLLSSRARSSRIAQAEQTFREMVEPFVLMNIRGNEANALRPGSTAVMTDGSRLERLGDGRFKHGGTTYRSTASLRSESDSLFNPQLLLGDDAYVALIPEQLAVRMERMSQTLAPENMMPLMKIIDKTTSWFKVSTLAHPSWLVGNVVGNVILAAMDRPGLLTNPREMAKYGSMIRQSSKAITQKNLGKLDDASTVMIGGREMKWGDLIEEANEHGVTTGGGIAGDAVRQFLGRQSQRAAATSSGLGSPGGVLGGLKEAFGDKRRAELARLSLLQTGGQNSRVDQVRAALKGFDSGVANKIVAGWFGANGSVDDGFRLAHYLMYLEDGYDAAAAGEKVRKAMLNFGDMTSFEQNWVRPIVPFYAWTRASLPNMIARTVQQPQHMAVVPKLAQAFEELAAGEDRIPRPLRPSWLNETLALQIGKDSSILAGTLLPQEGAVQAIGGVAGALGGLGLPTGFDGQDTMDALNWLAGQGAPAVKIPTELAFSRESFTGREIGLRPGEGDLSLEEYLFNQVRLFKEFGLGPADGKIAQAFERDGVVGGLSRLAIGGRFSKSLEEDRRLKAFFYELREDETRLRKAIKRADDPDEEDRYRVELMELYSNHLKKGGNPDDIPKWARDDLAELGLF